MVLTKYKAACVNSEPCWFDLEAGVQKSINLIGEAGKAGCKLIAFSETWIPGYPYWIWNVNYQQSLAMVKKLRENSLAIDSEEFRRIRRAARDNQIYVSLGFSEIDQGTLYITQTLIDPTGEVINHRRKIKPTHMEKVIYGDATSDTFKSVTQTELGRLGQLNCFENTNPFLKSLNVSEGEQIHIAAFPAGPASSFSDYADFIVPSYALTTAAWTLASFQTMSVEGLKKNTPEGVEPETDPSSYNGFTRIYKPDGTLAVRADKGFDGLLIVDIDLNECHLPKALADFGGHYTRPDLIRLLVDTRSKGLVTEADFNGSIPTSTTRDRLRLNVPLDAQVPKLEVRAADVPTASAI